MPYQDIPSSWQVTQGFPATAACLIVVPANVVKFVGA
jgi:hypothetical protein